MKYNPLTIMTQSTLPFHLKRSNFDTVNTRGTTICLTYIFSFIARGFCVSRLGTIVLFFFNDVYILIDYLFYSSVCYFF
jgi:hypothetical protein